MKRTLASAFLCLFISTVFGQTLTECPSTVYLDRMNILYVDVDNPITIYTGHNSTIVFDNGELKGGNGYYTIYPTKVGLGVLTITSEKGKKETYSFSVKEFPKPSIGNLSSEFTLDQLMTATNLDIAVEQKIFDLYYKVDSFVATKISSGTSSSIINMGNKFSIELKALIATLRSGDRLVFSNIQCSFLLTKKITANDLVISIK